MMAILSHNWLMSWRKKHIFINLSWHGGHGPLLSLFEDLEVLILHKSPIVWPDLSKTSAPFSEIKSPRQSRGLFVSLKFVKTQNHPSLYTIKDHIWPFFTNPLACSILQTFKKFFKSLAKSLKNLFKSFKLFKLFSKVWLTF